MDNDVSAGTGSTTTILGHLTLGLTLLAFGLGYPRVIGSVTAGATVRRASRITMV